MINKAVELDIEVDGTHTTFQKNKITPFMSLIPILRDYQTGDPPTPHLFFFHDHYHHFLREQRASGGKNGRRKLVFVRVDM